MPSQMSLEIAEIPAAANRLCAPAARRTSQNAAAALRVRNPAVIVTVARGSSDHAATYLKYAIETRTGVPVASVGPSVVTVWEAPLQTEGIAVLAISQSGRSPDLVALAAAYARGGAPVTLLTNTANSPLGDVATIVLDIKAGPETSVAATKSFVNSALAGLWLLADWQQDPALQEALEAAPERLAAALETPLPALAEALTRTDRLLVLGRGQGLGIAAEIALKCAEVCGIHASAFSAAEVLHGPSALIGPGVTVVLLDTDVAAATDAAAARIAAQGGTLLRVPAPTAAHPLLSGLEQLAAVYPLLEVAARARGRNPDAPPHLSKETSTL